MIDVELLYRRIAIDIIPSAVTTTPTTIIKRHSQHKHSLHHPDEKPAGAVSRSPKGHSDK